jgi:hypothetical protein
MRHGLRLASVKRDSLSGAREEMLRQAGRGFPAGSWIGSEESESRVPALKRGLGPFGTCLERQSRNRPSGRVARIAAEPGFQPRNNNEASLRASSAFIRSFRANPRPYCFRVHPRPYPFGLKNSRNGS